MLIIILEWVVRWTTFTPECTCSGTSVDEWVSKLPLFATALTRSADQPLCFLSFCPRLWCRLKHLQKIHTGQFWKTWFTMVRADCTCKIYWVVSVGTPSSFVYFFDQVKLKLLLKVDFWEDANHVGKVTLERTSGSATTSQRLFLRQFAPMRWDVFSPHGLLKPNQKVL